MKGFLPCYMANGGGLASAAKLWPVYPGRSAARSSCEAVRCRAGAQLATRKAGSRFCEAALRKSYALHRARDTNGYSLYAVLNPPQCRPCTRIGTSISRIMMVLPLPMSRA